jgi:flagellar protein FlaG
MDVSKIQRVVPIGPTGTADESPRPPDTRTVRAAGTGSQSKSSTGGGTSATSGAPQSTSAADAGGVLGPSRAEGGQLRDAAEDKRTADRAPDARSLSQAESSERLRQNFARLAEEARLPTNARLSIDVDSDTNEARFRVINKSSGDVIRQIPEEEFVELLRRIESREGLIDDEF